MIKYQFALNRLFHPGANIWGDSSSGCLVAGRCGQGDPSYHSCCQLQHGDDEGVEWMDTMMIRIHRTTTTECDVLLPGIHGTGNFSSFWWYRKNLVPEKSLGTSIGKNWYRKKVSEKFGTEKSTGIGIGSI